MIIKSILQHKIYRKRSNQKKKHVHIYLYVFHFIYRNIDLQCQLLKDLYVRLKRFLWSILASYTLKPIQNTRKQQHASHAVIYCSYVYCVLSARMCVYNDKVTTFNRPETLQHPIPQSKLHNQFTGCIMW